MSRSPWSIDGHLARLDAEGFQAVLPLHLPTPGLLRPRLAGAAPVDAAFLGIAPLGVPGAEPPVEWLDAATAEDASSRRHGLPPCEARVRGRELLVAYDVTEDALRFDVVWRVAPDGSCAGALLALDLIVSVHTQRLDARPEVFVLSRFAIPEVLWWDAVEVGTASRGASAAVSTIGQGVARRSGALIWRPAGAAPSYVEMVHPSDDLGTELIHETGGSLAATRGRSDAPSPDASGTEPIRGTSVREPTRCTAIAKRRLFAAPLEKGVLLRARLRGAMVDRAADVDAAARLYEAFASADPPLGA